jgi:hypothetical protein
MFYVISQPACAFLCWVFYLLSAPRPAAASLRPRLARSNSRPSHGSPTCVDRPAAGESTLVLQFEANNVPSSEGRVLKLKPPQRQPRAPRGPSPCRAPPGKAARLGRRVSAGNEWLLRRLGVRLMGYPAAVFISALLPPVGIHEEARERISTTSSSRPRQRGAIRASCSPQHRGRYPSG